LIEGDAPDDPVVMLAIPMDADLDAGPPRFEGGEQAVREQDSVCGEPSLPALPVNIVDQVGQRRMDSRLATAKVEDPDTFCEQPINTSGKCESIGMRAVRRG